jgi:hypothetical protein
MFRASMLLVPVLIAGCTGEVEYTGLTMNGFFPFDGSERSWDFVNTDETIPHTQVSTMNPDYATHSDGTTKIYDISTAQECPSSDESCEEKWVWTLRLSSNGSQGAKIHGYDRPDTGQVDFENAVGLTKGRMEIGETVVTESVDGHDWVAIFEAIEPCEIRWTDQWDSCARIKLESTPAGHWMAGQYWAITSYNIVARQMTEDTGRWELVYADWVP